MINSCGSTQQERSRLIQGRQGPRISAAHLGGFFVCASKIMWRGEPLATDQWCTRFGKGVNAIFHTSFRIADRSAYTFDSRPPMNPLFAPTPPEVPLKNAPLDRAICQVRFPRIMSIGQEEVVARYQEEVRQQYPVMSQQLIQPFQIQAPGSEIPISLIPSTRSYRFSSADQYWHLVLTQEFLAIETTHYSNRTEFLRRVYEACQALEKVVQPTHVSRLGVRYIDRIRGNDLDGIQEFFRPELMGLGADKEVWGRTSQVLTEALFTTAEGQLVARWGLLPAHSTTDPNAIFPEPDRSWILDLDASREGLVPFDLNNLVANATGLVERIYTFFRWSVTDSFLTHFGG